MNGDSGNRSPETIASAQCPLCGRRDVHEHSSLERVIFRNGQKATLAMLKEPKAYLHPATGYVISAAQIEAHTEHRRRQHQDPFYYAPLFEKPVLP